MTDSTIGRSLVAQAVFAVGDALAAVDIAEGILALGNACARVPDVTKAILAISATAHEQRAICIMDNSRSVDVERRSIESPALTGKGTKNFRLT